LWDDWMRPADQVLDDDQLLSTCTKPWPNGAQEPDRGRLGTPAEVVLRLLLLKHLRNWSYECGARGARQPGLPFLHAVGGGKVPTTPS